MTLDIQSFTFNHRDEFQRKSIAEKAISLLTADFDVSPMVIDGSWGTGKTEFCHKLINLMKEQEDGPNIVYIDAFKADHADEPLLTIIAEVLKLVPDAELDGVMQKILPALRFGLKTSAKAALGHLLRQDSTDVVDDFEKEIKQAADKAIDASVESLLKDHIKANESLKALQTALKNIASDKPIVLFIDELDRCRPNFAVDMLETIKHTFDVPSIQFVLITNTTQLKASINHIYGESVDAQRYLDKFLKFTFKLPHQVKENRHTKVQASIAHYRNLIDQNPIFGETKLKDEPALDLVNRIIEVNQLSLREIETLVRHLEIYQRLTNNEGLANNIIFGYMLLRLLGISLFSIKPELANSIVIGRADAKELGYFLGDEKIVALTEDHYSYLEHYQALLTMLGQECYVNSSLFTPETEESKKTWEKLIYQYFNRGGFAPDMGRRSQAVIETIDVLTLQS